jgi:hypothetical protein
MSRTGVHGDRGRETGELDYFVRVSDLLSRANNSDRSMDDGQVTLDLFCEAVAVSRIWLRSVEEELEVRATRSDHHGLRSLCSRISLLSMMLRLSTIAARSSGRREHTGHRPRGRQDGELEDVYQSVRCSVHAAEVEITRLEALQGHGDDQKGRIREGRRGWLNGDTTQYGESRSTSSAIVDNSGDDRTKPNTARRHHRHEPKRQRQERHTRRRREPARRESAKTPRSGRDRTRQRRHRRRHGEVDEEREARAQGESESVRAAVRDSLSTFSAHSSAAGEPQAPFTSVCENGWRSEQSDGGSYQRFIPSQAMLPHVSREPLEAAERVAGLPQVPLPPMASYLSGDSAPPMQVNSEALTDLSGSTPLAPPSHIPCASPVAVSRETGYVRAGSVSYGRSRMSRHPSTVREPASDVHIKSSARRPASIAKTVPQFVGSSPEEMRDGGGQQYAGQQSSDSGVRRPWVPSTIKTPLEANERWQHDSEMPSIRTARSAQSSLSPSDASGGYPCRKRSRQSKRTASGSLAPSLKYHPSLQAQVNGVEAPVHPRRQQPGWQFPPSLNVGDAASETSSSILSLPRYSGDTSTHPPSSVANSSSTNRPMRGSSHMPAPTMPTSSKAAFSSSPLSKSPELRAKRSRSSCFTGPSTSRATVQSAASGFAATSPRLDPPRRNMPDH